MVINHFRRIPATMANHSLVILKKEVIKADTFLFVFFGVMTLFLIILLSPNNKVGVAQGFNDHIDEAVESLKNAINLLKTKREVSEKKIKDTEDLKKESEKVSSAGESTGFGGNKTAEVKPISNIAVKRKAEEEDSSSKKMAGEKETAAAN